MTVPLIRSAALAPMIRWMRDNDRDPEPMLRRVDLGWYSADRPLEPIPLRFAMHFLSNLATEEGPDTPWRIVADRGFFELGLLAAVGLSATTPRGIMSMVAANMALHCTHEVFRTESTETSDLIVTDGWAMPVDDQSLHFVQQYCLAMVNMICSLTDCSEPRLRDIRMVPHPVHGLDHLRPMLGNRVSAHSKKNLRIEVPGQVADALVTFPKMDGEIPEMDRHWVSLRDRTSTSHSIVLLLKGMLRDGKPTIDRVAAAMGTSRRSLQRVLSAEETTFSEILDTARHQFARSVLSAGSTQIGDLSAELGYAGQSAFTRAFRRWEDATPTALSKKD
jgi:AraC-like DNA-binding protein